MAETSSAGRHGQEAGLDQGQAFALRAFLEGKSVAVVGGAGCGKSFFLKRLIREANRVHGDFPYVAPCALSNKAADSIKGTTIHRLFAAKPSWEFSKQVLMESLRRKPELCRTLKKIRVLIIDEISLLTSNIVDSIDYVLRELAESEWHSSLPLGGRQLIVAFDPFQLEPSPEHGYLQRDSLRTSYQSRLWYLTFGPPGDGVVVVLGSNHRQSKDKNFFQTLSRIRIGAHTQDDIIALNQTSKKNAEPTEGYTRLCLTNRQAAHINESKLGRLPHGIVRSFAVDTYCESGSHEKMTSIQRRLASVAPREVAFKVGAYVMLTRKMDDVLPGTHAIVEKVTVLAPKKGQLRYELSLKTRNEIHSFRRRENASISEKIINVRPKQFQVHSFDCKVLAIREQLPLIPAYALTIHRSQGLTLTNVAINFEIANSWKPNGMAYVALSRCSSSSGLWVKGLKDEAITVSERARGFINDLMKLNFYRPWRLWGAKFLPDFKADDSVTTTATRSSRTVKAVEMNEITGSSLVSSPCQDRFVADENNTHRKRTVTETSNLNAEVLPSKRRFQYYTA